MKSKQRFIEIMSALQMQHDSDIDYAENVAEAMGVEINPYNNSLLVNCLVDELVSWFDNPEAVNEEIRRFMYELDFDRDKYMVFHDFYESLNNDVIYSKEQMAHMIKEAKESDMEICVPTAMHNSDPFGNYVNREERKESIDKVEKRLFEEKPDAYDDIVNDFRQWDKTWRGMQTGLDKEVFLSELRTKYDVKTKM